MAVPPLSARGAAGLLSADALAAERAHFVALLPPLDGASPLRIDNYIGGAYVRTAAALNTYNPATAQVHALVPDSDASHVEAAVAAAQRAFPGWSALSRQQRADYMNAAADMIERNLETFAIAESRDQGKPIHLARAVDIPRAIYNLRFFAGAVLYQTERTSELETIPAINYVQRTPLGVAALITPWNLPLYLLTWKVAPCLATGNTFVAKPSELTSVTAYMLAHVLHRVGVPAGVCNFVFGSGPNVGSPLVSHPSVPLVSFTGGTVTGRRIREMAAPLGKKLSLELGGKNPSIIFGDVDVDAVAAETVRSSFTNQGEICLCTSRIYVEQTIFDQFVEALVKRAKAFTVGSPSNPGSNMAALNSKEHLAKVKSYIELANKEGATIHCGMEYNGGPNPELITPQEANGYFLRPTVITGVSHTSRCVTEEIFGPVVVVIPFTTVPEAIQLANGSSYGLSACVWCRDVVRAQQVARQLHAGTVWVNCWMVRDLNMPFGGVKDSGLGRESATESIDFYTEAKTICFKLA